MTASIVLTFVLDDYELRAVALAIGRGGEPASYDEARAWLRESALEALHKARSKLRDEDAKAAARARQLALPHTDGTPST